MGGANYKEIAPKNSFIDAREYTPLQLGQLLKSLNSNDEEYLQYYEWTRGWLEKRNGITLDNLIAVPLVF